MQNDFNNPAFQQQQQQNPQMNYNNVDQQQITNNQQQNNIVYYTKEELPQYQEGTNLQQIGEIITKLINSKQNWRDQFDAITHMRVLNKNYPQHVNQIFSNFGMQILENIEGVKTCTLKNTLLFINEVFMASAVTTLNDLVLEKFTPILLQKSIDESKIISLPAIEALTTLAANCNHYDAAYITIIKTAVLHKSPNVQDNSLKVLCQMFIQGKENVTKLQPQTFSFIMKGLTQTISNPRSSIKASSKQVMETMAEVIGNQNYINMMQNVLTLEEQKIIRDNYEESLNRQSKSKAKDINQNRKTISQLKSQAKSNMDPLLKQGANIIEIKTWRGEQYQGILQQQDMNVQQNGQFNYNNNNNQFNNNNFNNNCNQFNDNGNYNNNNMQSNNNNYFNQNQQNFF